MSNVHVAVVVINLEVRPSQVGMRRGDDRWWYEGYSASWDDLNPIAKLKMIVAMPDHPEV